eukprot:UN00831
MTEILATHWCAPLGISAAESVAAAYFNNSQFHQNQTQQLVSHHLIFPSLITGSICCKSSSCMDALFQKRGDHLAREPTRHAAPINTHIIVPQPIFQQQQSQQQQSQQQQPQVQNQTTLPATTQNKSQIETQDMEFSPEIQQQQNIDPHVALPRIPPLPHVQANQGGQGGPPMFTFIQDGAENTWKNVVLVDNSSIHNSGFKALVQSVINAIVNEKPISI